MIWSTEDGEHEGQAAAEFPDGRFLARSPGGSMLVQLAGPGQEAPGGERPQDEADGRTAIGWRGICSCGWRGPLWRRVPAEAAADPARRLVYWAGPSQAAEPPDDIGNAIGDEWRGHLPLPVLAAVKAAAATARKAGEDLDDVVLRARDAGATWAAIGGAAGMTRQAANERWGKRRLPAADELFRLDDD